MFGKRGSSKTVDMINGPLISSILRYSLPLMFSGFVQILFNAADTAVVGHFVGDNALAAVGASGSICALFTNLFIGLSVGANVAAARACGARDIVGVRRVVHTSMLLSVICGAAVMILGLIFSPMMLRLMDTPKEIIDQAALYLRIYFVGMLPAMIYNFGSAILRSVGDTRRPMIYLMISGAVNVVLNLILVIVFRLDVAGVAIATAISQTLSATLVVACLLRSHNEVRLEPRRLRIHKAEALQIMRVGLPASLQSTLFSISNVIIASAYNSFGAIVVAGNSVGSHVDILVNTAMSGFYQAAVSFTGQNCGARKYGRVKKIYGTTLLLEAAIALPLSVVIWLFGDTIMRIYSNSQPVLDAGMIRLTFICLPYMIAGFMDVTASTLRGMGISLMPTLVMLGGVCGTRLVWIYSVCRLPRFADKIEMVYACYPISWALTGMFLFVCFSIAIRRLIRSENSLDVSGGNN